MGKLAARLIGPSIASVAVLIFAMVFGLVVVGGLFQDQASAAPAASIAAAIGNPHRAGVGLKTRHPVSIVEADVYVNRSRTTMRLKCFAEDLELLQGVEALEDGFYDSEELIDATKDHAKYLAEKITIRDVNGELLKPKIVEIIPIEIPDGGIAAGKLMDYQMGFVFEYDYRDAPQPRFLTLEQKMVAEGQLLPSEFKALVKQAGSRSGGFKMMKPNQPETFEFDWDQPELSDEASEKEREEWFVEQRKKTLGITSYSSVYSFIYITDYEVRHEVLIPLATLSTLMEIDRADDSFLEIEEQAAAAEKIKTFFSVGNPVRIDGVEVSPVFDRVDFYGLDLRDFAVQAEKRKVSMANGRVGLIMSYSTKGRPTKVELEWDKFNNVIKTVDAVVFIGDEVEKTQFSMFLSDNTYRWQAPNREPLPELTGVSASMNLEQFTQKTLAISPVTIGLWVASLPFILVGLFGFKRMLMLGLGVGLIAVSFLFNNLWPLEINHPLHPNAPAFEVKEEEAKTIFAQLHKNLFRAFDYHDESDIYDALANSVEGEQLRQLYLDITESLRVKEQGGAIARIDEVTLLNGEQVAFDASDAQEGGNPYRFKYRCQWKLDGTIEHWGHIHRRETEYDGEFEIQLINDAWKITDMKVVDQEQGVVKTNVRTFDPKPKAKPDPKELE